ncbi:hypothetical protein C6345_13455 [Bacillus sp. LNXM12-2]|uniref:DUF4097 family beta strand repeat-containing protein n=1 Tax=unclassified Bacillus (in: firmicutes) TaxID=185979 RepID=UPI000D0515BE|nr:MULTISPECIES: DUF4097 family beta strand repeat-containing protein [unclassified Bacillus (in: firmicutes)]PSB69053.1 hypothetical protein C6Y07_14960 [Bacillus sp. LNXM12-1]PSB72956.1 hypothetical protein C6345_13455 [Bacillus sp. LNXM12-2]
MEHTVQIEESVVELSLDWLLGEVRIHHHDHPYLFIRQTTNQAFPQRYLLHHQVRDGRLVIQDRRKKILSLGLHLYKTDVAIYLPKQQLQSISLRCKGTNLQAERLKVENVSCHLTSGKTMLSGEIKHLHLETVGGLISSRQLVAQRLLLHATSSKVELTGAFSDVDLHVTGRRMQIHSTKMLDSLKSTSTGAYVKVEIPENDGFTCYVKKRSGAFRNDFSCHLEKGKMVHKNGLRSFEIDIRGGQFLISHKH